MNKHHAHEAEVAESQLDPQTLLLIVVGAHLRSELHDRPLAYRVQDLVTRWQNDQRGGAFGETETLGGHSGANDLIIKRPIVCTDLWYLNAKELLDRPTICIGDPSVNAAAAYLSTRLPTAFVIEHSLRIHLDLDFIDAQACIWGIDHDATVSGVDVFVERYLEPFLRCAHELPMEA